MRFPFSKPILHIYQLVLKSFKSIFRQALPTQWRSRITGLAWKSLPSIFAAIAILPAIYLNFLQPIEFWAYNNFTNWRGDYPWDNRLVIVAIDDKSISKIGRFPWQRDQYTQILQKLSQAKVVGFDILWSEASNQDQELAKEIDRNQKAVLSMAWDREGQALLPVKEISNVSANIGHILKREDADGIVRQVDLQLQNVPLLGIAMLQVYNLSAEELVALPDLKVPFLLNWTRSVKNIPHFSFSDVLDGSIDSAEFRDKIVLIGVTASGIDGLVTPLDRNPPASGVHLHSMVLQNLLQDNALTKISNYQAFVLLGSLLMSLVLPRRNLWLNSLSAFSLSGLWFAIAFFSFTANYWLDVALPIAMFVLTGSAIAIQERWQAQKQLKLARDRIGYEQTHDRLTGLFNRPMIEERLQKLLNRSLDDAEDRASSNKENDAQLMAILWLNLDRFKNINDVFGHPIGNLLLVEIAQMLKSVLPREAAIARFGGAEFVILLENLANEQAAISNAENILTQLQNSFLIQNSEISVAAHIGIKFHQVKLNSCIDYDSSEPTAPDLLLRDADTAMFYAKNLGVSLYRVFEISMRERVLERLQLEKDLRRAVAIAPDAETQELEIYYQPILSLHNMQIVGLEALIRWRHPERGLISPNQFIPLAEETGLIIPIGDWILRRACLQVKSWQQRFEKAKNITVSVNLSPKQLAQDNLLAKCLDTLKVTELDPKYLKIELTESSIMENPNFAVNVLSAMRNAGIKIYIDDFGTGYSSLAYLHKFPFDGLKIDRSFVNNINTNTSGMEILQAIVSLANSVKAHIVAEGIENIDQLNYLQNLLEQNGDGQGFFLFRPLDVHSIEQIFQTI